MQSKEIFTRGPGLTPPWKLKDQRLELDKNPHEPYLRIEAERGSTYPCPECGASRLVRPTILPNGRGVI